MTSIDILKTINNIDDKYILEALPSIYKEEKKVLKLKYIFSFIFIIVISILVITNLNKPNHEVAINNPYQEVKTIDEAEALVGFDFNLPNLDYETKYNVISNQIIEVDYQNKFDTNIILRKAYGNDDISGDYSTYENIEEINIDNIDITFKNSNELILITFTKDNYSYSIYANNLSKDESLELTKKIIEIN